LALVSETVEDIASMGDPTYQRPKMMSVTILIVFKALIAISTLTFLGFKTNPYSGIFIFTPDIS
jgi:hypothetical protein